MIVFAGRYNDSEILSGPEKVAKRIFHHCAKENEAVFVQYFFDGRKYGTFKKLFGKEITVNEDNSKIITLGIIRIIYFFLFNKFEIIHLITFERFAFIFYLLKFFTKAKYIFSVHGIVTFGNYELKNTPRLYRFKDKICEKVFFKYSDVIIMPSPNYIDLTDKYFKYDKTKVQIIPNGCDIEFHNVKRAERNNYELNIAFQTDKIGFDFSYRFLINGLTHIKSKINLFAIGESDINELIKKDFPIIKKNKMLTYIYAKFLSDTDIFLSINKYDTFSISALEAMAAGVIVILTKETGLASFIKYGLNGFTIEFGDDSGIINSVNSLLNSPDKFKMISNNAREIYNDLNWDKVYARYSEIYKGLIK